MHTRYRSNHSPNRLHNTCFFGFPVESLQVQHEIAVGTPTRTRIAAADNGLPDRSHFARFQLPLLDNGAAIGTLQKLDHPRMWQLDRRPCTTATLTGRPCNRPCHRRHFLGLNSARESRVQIQPSTFQQDLVGFDTCWGSLHTMINFFGIVLL
jgi:hypothetical protein